ncbi:hypothetical protein [Streptomyces sp. NPDC097619]|uniref:hypothetical protein n=1 Tax=Streptomyces sp. NPDC097619 TaxID=3157228 RepID=UPI0033222073
MRVRRGYDRAVLLASLLALTGAAVPAVASAGAGTGGGAARGGGEVTRAGVVRGADGALRDAVVTVFESGSRFGDRPRRLGSTRTDRQGRFRVTYDLPEDAGSVVYLTADARAAEPAPEPTLRRTAPAAPGTPATPTDQRAGDRAPATDRVGRPTSSLPVRLAAVLTGAPGDGGGAPSGRARTPDLTITERTTVAAGFALAQFTRNGGVAGPWPGPRNAASVSHNLADVITGGVSPFLAAPPNGTQTSTLRAFNSLADAVAACTTNARNCPDLFDAARPSGEDRPRDTLQAVADIARAPETAPRRVFQLSERKPVHQPALTSAPAAWTLALRYQGNGRELDGPGNIAFDRAGDAWVVNNYTYGADPRDPVCGGRQLLRLRPDGRDAAGAPYTGGGLYGAGYGVAIAPDGDVWAANFGFQGRGCGLDPSPLFRSVSQFDHRGRALSPAQGWRQGGFVQPQGALADRNGVLWVANCGSRSVTRVPTGRPEQARNLPVAGGALVKPFGVSLDGRGRAWVTGNGSDSVAVFAPNGTLERTVTGGGLANPIGIASDSAGNQWVANSGVIPLPCEDGTTDELATAAGPAGRTQAPGASVTLIRRDGTSAPVPFTTGSLTLPWGIAVDGSDTVWVADFSGQRVTRLCGARPESCPPGHGTGQPISPASAGYGSDGLVRNTAVQIDPSGNVWLTNNWELVPLQTNPGGRQLVLFVGLATPVRTPLIGTPRPL